MPRYHFDVKYDDRPISLDEEGLELSSSEEALHEAFDLVPTLAKDHLVGCRSLTILVRDGEPQPVVTLRVSMVVEERS
jgi:hypothetical protein